MRAVLSHSLATVEELNRGGNKTDDSLYDSFARYEDTHWWFVARRHIILRVLKKCCAPGSHSIVLDAGCGTGGMLRHLAQFGQVHGVDSSEEKALGYARDRNPEAILSPGSLEALPYDDASFDLVTCLDVLEHIPNDFMALSEIWRVLRNEGNLVVTVPAYPWLWSRHDVLNHHHRRYVRKRLKQMLESTGFTVRYISYFNTLLFPVAMVQRLTSRLLVRLGNIIPVGFRSPLAEALSPWNTLLLRIFLFEEVWLPRVTIPFGLSVICVAHKPRK